MKLAACALVPVAACSARTSDTCAESAECVSAGTQGVCEVEGFCAFPDDQCASGYRFEPIAGGGLGGTCVSGAAIDAGIPPTPIAFVQTTATSFSSTTGLLSFDQPVQAHHAIVACADFGSATAGLAVSDSLGSQFTQVVTLTNGNGRYYVFAAFDVPGGPDTVTYTLPATASVEVYIHEYAGLSGFDVGAAAAGTGTANTQDGMASGAVDTAAGNELIFGFGVTGRAVAGTGFTTRSSFHSNITQDKVVDVAGSYQATATMTSGTTWEMLVAAFTGS